MGDNKNHDDETTGWANSRFDEFGEDEFETSDRDSDFDAIRTEEVEEDDPGDDPEGGLWDFVEDPPGEDRLDPAHVEETLTDDDFEWEIEETGDAPAPESWLRETREEGGSRRELNLSLGMIAIAVAALILLAIGGYGIIEQRATLREEVRELRAQLATAAQPAEVSATRAAAQAADTENRELRAEVEQLSQENRSLQAIVKGLEAQLGAQQEALQKEPAPETNPAPEPAEAAAAPAAGASGEWFVNFSSYTERGTAEQWVGEVEPPSGRAVVATAQSGGRTIYRVRVVELADKATAESVARALEKEFDLPRLWVGRER